VTWGKHAETGKLAALEESRFVTEFVFNDKHYGVFEEEKTLTVDSEPDRHNVTPRRIFVWNKTSRRRASGLAWTGGMEMNTQECATAILSRRGASENTFEHLHDRHPFHYYPGFKLVESDLEDYQSIQRVDDEGKYLFDFVTAPCSRGR
jgi:hypothetical protein